MSLENSAKETRKLDFLCENSKNARRTDDQLDDLLQNRPAEETKQNYSKWAKNYEEDIVDMGYNGGPIAAHCFLALNVPKNAHIIDIGAGTGIVGAVLQSNGYQHIDALDGNEDMLAVLKGKGCYRSVVNSMVSPEVVLPVEEKSYDVAILAGVFLPGHIAIRSLEQIVKVVKSGGLVCWSMGAHEMYADRDEQYRDGHFDQYLQQLTDAGVWRPVFGYPVVAQNYLHGKPGLFYAMKVV